MLRRSLLYFFLILCSSHLFSQQSFSVFHEVTDDDVLCGAERTDIYFPWIKGKKIALVANHSSMIGSVHLVDSLIDAGFEISKVFSPEHGFRGQAEAGEHTTDGVDAMTGLEVISLYGRNRKPLPSQLDNVDVILFDIQDVGARFYTYISTLHLVMEACAENAVPIIILDRPNPNGFYVDGPVLDTAYRSFVGMDAIPIVHGMTMAELALMINGEKWLKNGVQCNMKFVTCKGYDHSMYYHLPIAPSPNLQTMESIWLYPSLCLFEATVMSIGRGTEKPFEVLGHPDFPSGNYTFTPMDIPGKSTNPKFEGETCKGIDLKTFSSEFMTAYKGLYLDWLVESYKELGQKEIFFKGRFFDKLAGGPELRQMIIEGKSPEEIKASWETEIKEFKDLRKKYLLYTDFE